VKRRDPQHASFNEVKGHALKAGQQNIPPVLLPQIAQTQIANRNYQRLLTRRAANRPIRMIERTVRKEKVNRELTPSEIRIL
jgi:hypothetical protein